MMSYSFDHLNIEFTEDKLLITRISESSNLVFPYSKIQEIHLTGKEGRFYHPSIIIHMKDDSKYKIMGYGIISRPSRRKEFSEFVLSLHQHLDPYKKSIIFKSGMSLPKWGILGLLCLGMLAIYNSTLDTPVFKPESSLLFGLVVITVSIMFMRTNGGTYDPENIPAKLL